MFDLGRVSFIKCDIEGAEYLFLEGARNVLKRDRPVVVCEVEERHTIRYGYTPEDFFASLKASGYRPFRYFNGVLLPVDGPDSLENNYVFIPEEEKLLTRLLTNIGKPGKG